MPTKRAELARDFGVTAHETPGEWLHDAAVVVLAVKPQQMRAKPSRRCATGSARRWSSRSRPACAATTLARWLGHERIVRAMPNTPALIRAGITGAVALPGVTDEQHAAADRILRSVGEVLWLGRRVVARPGHRHFGQRTGLRVLFHRGAAGGRARARVHRRTGAAAGGADLRGRGPARQPVARSRSRCCASASRRKAARPLPPWRGSSARQSGRPSSRAPARRAPARQKWATSSTPAATCLSAHAAGRHARLTIASGGTAAHRRRGSAKRSITVPANSASPTQLLCRNAAKQPSRERVRISAW